MVLKELSNPFAAKDIEWRVQQSGGFDKKPWAMVLAYVTNRAVQQRLDDVCGIENWRNEFDKSPDGGVMCGISVRVIYDPNSYDIDSKPAAGGFSWVTKWDGAENTQVEAVKGGLSGAMKRAAVQWGIGRYLYNLDTNFVNLLDVKPENMEGYQSIWSKENKKRYYWKTPELPAWALPEQAKENK